MYPNAKQKGTKTIFPQTRRLSTGNTMFPREVSVPPWRISTRTAVCFAFFRCIESLTVKCATFPRETINCGRYARREADLPTPRTRGKWSVGRPTAVGPRHRLNG
ncbi:hypothetical protein GWI33_011646 [Rhynchophorus ferrugineus]|uniref:Uncharacterized protein n=1 Tax=Rhynchophorus ferrugineus TaxID=354439 RepID=A0A834I6Q5_RHYFE|nr:hypothetical protein GWI33_011646 [Rhynchophorus ferrugineus]